eukprot:2423041-Prymnesium_polylepis.1
MEERVARDVAAPTAVEDAKHRRSRVRRRRVGREQLAERPRQHVDVILVHKRVREVDLRSARRTARVGAHARAREPRRRASRPLSLVTSLLSPSPSRPSPSRSLRARVRQRGGWVEVGGLE